MEIGENKRSHLVTAACITLNMFNTIHHSLGLSSVDTFDKIAELTCEFEENNKGVEWENVGVDREETLMNFVNEKIDEATGAPIIDVGTNGSTIRFSDASSPFSHLDLTHFAPVITTLEDVERIIGSASQNTEPEGTEQF
jgi:hypothetical protein